jgi:hypothetical protein
MFDDVEGALGSPGIDRYIAGYRGITSERARFARRFLRANFFYAEAIADLARSSEMRFLVASRVSFRSKVNATRSSEAARSFSTR